MEIHLKITGIICVLLAFMHLALPKRFNWKGELPSLGLFNRQVFKVHTLFIALTVLLMGVLLLTSSYELLNTTLGLKILIGFSVFWGLRMLFQFFFYSPKLWWGKPFETFVHILFSCIWIYMNCVFLFSIFKN